MMTAPFAIYFPQFYPTPTNDRVWGKGFTDWTLLANANVRQCFDRRAPARGLYDGADPAIHHAQFAEMKLYGIGGIGLYHYWFYSHQELDAVERGLRDDATGEVPPWFLIWASEGWSKRWIGDPTSVVDLDPSPSLALIEAHCHHLALCFGRPGYFRWNGRPLFIWYNLGHFQKPAALVERYRTVLARLGFDVAFAHFIKNESDIALAPLVDASYLFEPRLFFNFGRASRGRGAKALHDGIRAIAGEKLATRLLVINEKWANRGGSLRSATDFTTYLASSARSDFVDSIPGAVAEVISPGWNNAPRYDDRFTALEALSGAQFGDIISRQNKSSLPTLINAWNEWTENAAIEPCAYYGTRYLDAIKPQP